MSTMVRSARGEGLGWVSGQKEEGRGIGQGGALGLFLELVVVVGRAGSGTGQETAAVSAALPYFDCLIDAACHYVGSSLVEICKRGKHLFRWIKDYLI